MTKDIKYPKDDPYKDNLRMLAKAYGMGDKRVADISKKLDKLTSIHHYDLSPELSNYDWQPDKAVMDEFGKKWRKVKKRHLKNDPSIFTEKDQENVNELLGNLRTHDGYDLTHLSSAGIGAIMIPKYRDKLKEGFKKADNIYITESVLEKIVEIRPDYFDGMDNLRQVDNDVYIENLME